MECDNKLQLQLEPVTTIKLFSVKLVIDCKGCTV